jgi:glutamine synthetase
MTSLARAAAVCVAALSLVVASGCGGDTKSANDYVKSINKVQTDFVASMNAVGSSSSSSDPAGAAKATFAKIDTGLQKVAAELKDISPPDKVKDLHQDMIAEINDLDTEVKKIAGEVGSGDIAKLGDVQTEFATKATQLQDRFAKTITDINQKLQG